MNIALKLCYKSEANSGSLALAEYDLLLNLLIHLIKAFVVTHLINVI